jgi:Protein of unknown function (DUF2934)
MTATITPASRRWTDARIEDDLRAAIAELGEFPTRAQLITLGQRSLWDAMRRTGGAEQWRRRMTVHSLPTPEQIAERAYELYQAGADGDSVAHWLEAERELAG